MEMTKETELSLESREALKRALIGVKDKREEALILLLAVPGVLAPRDCFAFQGNHWL